MFIIIYITYPDQKTAEDICKQLLEKRLVVCANILPIKSLYWWKGKIENNDEIVSIVKTSNSNWESVRDEVVRLHPYDVPCIMKLDVEANKEYEAWIDNETEKKE